MYAIRSYDDKLVPPADACPPRQGVCRQSVLHCAGADGWTCGLPEVYEEDETLCDGLDNDCDGDVDTADSDVILV